MNKLERILRVLKEREEAAWISFKYDKVEYGDNDVRTQKALTEFVTLSGVIELFENEGHLSAIEKIWFEEQ